LFARKYRLLRQSENFLHYILGSNGKGRVDTGLLSSDRICWLLFWSWVTLGAE